VHAQSSDDAKSIDAIRMHLKRSRKSSHPVISTKPFAVHATNRPGVDVMASRRDRIKYECGEIENGARVRITTTGAAALAAVHRLLEFQIEEHRTGD
jgi:hypothetical protein